jgi:antitoxin component of MazEF toxin-antitoxin module
MAQKVIKTGNSAAVTLPADFVKDLGIRIGDPVKVKLDPENNKVVYIFSGTKQLLLSESFLKKKRLKKKK